MALVGMIAFFLATLFVIDVHIPAIRLALIPILFLFGHYRERIHVGLKALSTRPRWVKGILVFLALLIVARGIHVETRFHRDLSHVEDIAILNVDGVVTLLDKGKNPYTEPINDYVVNRPGFYKNYNAYKYPPLQLLAYAPFVKLWGLKGILAANLLVYVAMLVSLFVLLRPLSLFHAGLGCIFFLSTDYFFVLSFNKGTNDSLPALIMLWALVAFQRHRPMRAAIILGLSLLVKQLPAGLLAFFLFFQRRWKECALSAGIFVLGSLPFLIWGWRGYYENVVEFVITRPTRETSMLDQMPSWVQSLIPLLGIALCAVLAAWGRKNKRWSLIEGWNLITIGTLIFLVTSKMAPTHYFVWITGPLIMWMLTPTLTEQRDTI